MKLFSTADKKTCTKNNSEGCAFFLRPITALSISIIPTILTLLVGCNPALGAPVKASPTSAFTDAIGLNVRPITDQPQMITLLQQAHIKHVRTNITQANAFTAGGIGWEWLPDTNWFWDYKTNKWTYNFPSYLSQFTLSPADYMEGPNEPDLSGVLTAARASTLLAQTQQVSVAARAVNLKVVGPSILQAGETGVGNLTPYCDFGNGHVYSWFPEVSNQSKYGDAQKGNYWLNLSYKGPSQLDAFIDSIAPVNYPGLPWEMTEFGWCTQGAYAVSQLAQAKLLSRGYAYLFNHVTAGGVPITRSFCYDLQDQYTPAQFLLLEQTSGVLDANGNPTSPANAQQLLFDQQQNSYGLIAKDGTIKTAFKWLSNMTNILSASTPAQISKPTLDFSLTGQPTSANLQQQLLQSADGNFYLMLWQGVPSCKVITQAGAAEDLALPAAPVTLTVSSPVSKLTVYDISTGTSPIKTVSGQQAMSLSVPDYPIIVNISLANATPPVTPPVSTPPVAPPVAKPPVAPPVVTPPVAKPPVTPPVVTPPVAKPPVTPPVVTPPVAKPPITPPVVTPPVAKPPVTPPVVTPPVVKPPVAPPVVTPPVAKPPVTPPIVTPPVAKPPISIRRMPMDRNHHHKFSIYADSLGERQINPVIEGKPANHSEDGRPNDNSSHHAATSPTTGEKFNHEDINQSGKRSKEEEQN